jgi:hypothetical protein
VRDRVRAPIAVPPDDSLTEVHEKRSTVREVVGGDHEETEDPKTNLCDSDVDNNNFDPAREAAKYPTHETVLLCC